VSGDDVVIDAYKNDKNDDYKFCMYRYYKKLCMCFLV
jgi:hypothetical protein